MNKLFPAALDFFLKFFLSLIYSLLSSSKTILVRYSSLKENPTCIRVLSSEEIFKPERISYFDGTSPSGNIFSNLSATSDIVWLDLYISNSASKEFEFPARGLKYSDEIFESSSCISNSEFENKCL